jgi:hypothetical protein
LTADPAGGAAVPATAGLAVPLSVELLDLGAEPERRMRTLDRGLQPTVGRELVNPRQRDAEPGVQINNVAAVPAPSFLTRRAPDITPLTCGAVIPGTFAAAGNMRASVF